MSTFYCLAESSYCHRVGCHFLLSQCLLVVLYFKFAASYLLPTRKPGNKLFRFEQEARVNKLKVQKACCAPPPRDGVHKLWDASLLYLESPLFQVRWWKGVALEFLHFPDEMPSKELLEVFNLYIFSIENVYQYFISLLF